MECLLQLRTTVSQHMYNNAKKIIQLNTSFKKKIRPTSVLERIDKECVGAINRIFDVLSYDIQ